MLNEAKIRAAKPRPSAYKLTDSHRLYLLVKPNGSKLWKWNYSFDGKQKTMAFGVYPKVGLGDARIKRDEASMLLDEARDPGVVKKLKIEENLAASRQTFEKVAREWHENAKCKWATIHVKDVIRGLERDVFPAIGALPIADLTPPLVLPCSARSRAAARSRRPEGCVSEFLACSSTRLPKVSLRPTRQRSSARCSSRSGRGVSPPSPSLSRCER